MVSYVFPPPPVAALPIKGSDALFPVRRIFCVGRNYAEHAIEMGSDPTREPPFYFTKPAWCHLSRGCDGADAGDAGHLPRIGAALQSGA